jgi:uncharacterized membrane protein YqgA involved in biofilm formation
MSNMEKGINTLVSKLQQLMSAKGKKKAPAHESYIQSYGDYRPVLRQRHRRLRRHARRDDRRRQHSDCQSVSRFFHRHHFRLHAGIAVAAISVPMLLIQLTLAACAALIMPLTTPMMLADFSAVGGMLLVATGLRICGIKMFAVVNMLPALVLAMPISAAWTLFFA